MNNNDGNDAGMDCSVSYCKVWSDVRGFWDVNGRWETRSKFLLMCLLGWQQGVRRCVASNDTTKIATATPPFVVASDVGVVCGWSKQQLTNVARVSLLHMYRCCTCIAVARALCVRK